MSPGSADPGELGCHLLWTSSGTMSLLRVISVAQVLPFLPRVSFFALPHPGEKYPETATPGVSDLTPKCIETKCRL